MIKKVLIIGLLFGSLNINAGSSIIPFVAANSAINASIAANRDREEQKQTPIENNKEAFLKAPVKYFLSKIGLVMACFMIGSIVFFIEESPCRGALFLLLFICMVSWLVVLLTTGGL